MWTAFTNMGYLQYLAGGNDMRNTPDNKGKKKDGKSS